MLHFEQTIDAFTERFTVFGCPAEKVLFFDIETTGFSPESSYVYLIGCAFLSGGAVKLRQWFLDDISEEKEMVREFGEFSKNFQIFVYYNGTTFDLPYLQKKARCHRLDETYFCMEESFDLYRHLLPFKKLLGLKDYKQKTLEQFLGVLRKDVYCGGDLIPVYKEFTGRYRYECIMCGKPFKDTEMKTPAGGNLQEQASSLIQSENQISPCFSAQAERQINQTFFAQTENQIQTDSKTPDFTDTGLTSMPKSTAKALLCLLLLHNREDITGLLCISAFLGLSRLQNGAFTVTELSAGDVEDMGFSDENADSRGLSACLSTPCKILRLDTELEPALLSSCFAGRITKPLPDGALAADGNPAAVSLFAAPADVSSACTAPATAPTSAVCAAPAAVTPASTVFAAPAAISSPASAAIQPDTAFSAVPVRFLLFVPVLSGTFKYFFENYKDYYYLPMEDCAMHKSVAQFVDKDYRKRATKETCYQKKEGFFLPQPTGIITPAFRLHAKDALSYFENTKTALADPSVLKDWTLSLLKWLFS